MEAFEAQTYDLRFKVLRGPGTPDDSIVIITIDEKSIRELGRYPWSRKCFVDLLDSLSAAGAKAILIDAFFPEEESPDVDREFAAAIKRAGNVILATAFGFDADGTINMRTDSISPLTKAAKRVAHMNFFPEEDGVNRRAVPLISYKGKDYPGLGLAGAMEALGVADAEFGYSSVIVGNRKISLDSYDSMLINHTGPAGMYRMYSFSDVVKGRVDPRKLQHKIVFVGATALGIYDMRVTPFHSNTPGVEINANIADNIINNNFMQQGVFERLIDLLSIIVLGVTVFFITIRPRPYLAFTLILTMIISYSVFAYAMFLAGHWLSLIYPFTSIFIAYSVSASFRFITIDRQAKDIRSMFSNYVSGKIVDRLVSDPDAARIGGDSRMITIIFCDIKGFTSFSEKANPYEVVKTLNTYLDLMTQEIMNHNGTVDKFLGDGVMAYWGAPLEQKDHAELAVQCTLAMSKKMRALKEKREKSGEVPLSFRVGINTGEVIAGNIGAQGKKMEYTVIGDNVNLGSRLEGAAKFFRVDILVSESTFRLTCDKFVYRELDYLRVVGRSTPINTYELLGAKEGPLVFEEGDYFKRYGEALELYRNREWQGAKNVFDELSKEDPNDKPVEHFRSRCEFHVDNPPPDDWDGVFDRREK